MKCANDIFKAWAYAQEKGQCRPEALQQFRTRLEKRVKANTGRILDEWLNLGSRTQQRVSKWSAIIYQNWACEVMEILPNQYATDKPLSQSVLKRLADLSALSSLDVGRKLLQEAIDHRKMPSKTEGRNFHGTNLTPKDVIKAIEKAREIHNNTQAAADRPKRTDMGPSKKPTSNKRKRDPSPTQSLAAASVPLTQETLGSTPDETPDPVHQELPNKKLSAESWWTQKLWFQKGHERDNPSRIVRNEILDQHLAGPSSESTTTVRETDVLEQGVTVHQSTPVPHQQMDDTTDEDLVFHRDESKRYKRTKSQESYSNEVQGFHSMSPEQVRCNTMSPSLNFNSCLGPTLTSQGNQRPMLDSDIGSPSDEALRVSDAHPCSSERMNQNHVQVVIPLRKGNHSDGTLGSCAQKIKDQNELEGVNNIGDPQTQGEAVIETSPRQCAGSTTSASDLPGSESIHKRTPGEAGARSSSLEGEEIASPYQEASSHFQDCYRNMPTPPPIAGLPKVTRSKQTKRSAPPQTAAATRPSRKKNPSYDPHEFFHRPMVSAQSYIQKAGPQKPSSLGRLMAPSRSAMPTSDLQGAISSLSPGTWLSSTAIQLSLEYCQTDGVRIFDPSFLSSASQKILNPLSPNDSTLIFPLQVNGNHWALVVADTANVTAEFWDSLPDPNHESEARNAVHDLGRTLRGGVSKDAALTEWILAPQPCPRQDNSNECGIYTIVFAMHRILKLPIPQSIDSHLWRQVLRVLLDDGTELTWNDQERYSTETPIPEPSEGAVRISEVKAGLRQNTALLSQSLLRSQCDVTRIKGVMDLSKIFQERQTELCEGYMNKLRQVIEKVTAYRKMSSAFDEIDMNDDDKAHFNRTQTLLHKYEKTEQAQIQSKLSRTENIVQGWARVTKTCEKENERRKDRVDETKNEIRRVIIEQKALVEAVSQLQDELISSVS